jgi:hypothetical protein
MKIECKGRNGYFNLDRVDVWHGTYDKRYWVDFYSKSPLAKNPPMRFSGSKTDILRLIRKLESAVATGQSVTIEQD